jgi:hypothetical protein
MFVRENSVRLKNLLEEISPFIEEFTSEICPGCPAVCCKQKHGYHDEDDMIYLSSLGLDVPSYDRRSPDDPCEFLSLGGCSKPRWQRPYRCTWYFCERLLHYMPEKSARKYRKIVSRLQSMLEVRMSMIT